MRLKLGIGSWAKKLHSSSSLKGKPHSGGEDSEFNRKTSFGSKDEAFFVSQAWLDSDCEDDFFSVNGDLIPSRGSTPNNHQINTDGTLHILEKISSSKTSPESKSESSPTDGKRRLAELLKESQVEEQNHSNSNEQTKVNGKLANQCCLPSLVHCFSFRERRSRKTYS